MIEKKSNPKKGPSEAGVITEPGNSIQKRTGDWRTFKPVVDKGKCIGCSICTWYCPDSAIRIEEKEGKKVAVIDYEHCKGCLVCMGECPQQAISKEKE